MAHDFGGKHPLALTWSIVGLAVASLPLLLPLVSKLDLKILAWTPLGLSIIYQLLFIVFAFEYLASGHLFPLDILPPALTHALQFTPFPYQLYFPISVYLGKTAGTELVQGSGLERICERQRVHVEGRQGRLSSLNCETLW